eukprot:19216-Heterococcus_DN1.PRE.1
MSDETSVCYSSNVTTTSASSSSKTVTATADSSDCASTEKSLTDNTMQSDDVTVCTSPTSVRNSAKCVNDTTATNTTGTASDSPYTDNSAHSSNDTTGTTTSSNSSNDSSNDNIASEALPTQRTMLKLHQLSSLSSFGSSDSNLLDYSGTDVQNFNETILLKLKTPPKIERYRSTGDSAYNSTTAAATKPTSSSSAVNDAADDISDDGFADDDDNSNDVNAAYIDSTAHLHMSQQARLHSQSYSDQLIPSQQQQQSGLAATVSMPQSLLHSNRSSLRRDHSLRKAGITNGDSNMATAVANGNDSSSIGLNKFNSTVHDSNAVLPYSNASLKQSTVTTTATDSSLQSNRLQQSTEQQAHTDSNNTLYDGAVTPERSKRTSSAVNTTSSTSASTNSASNAPSLMQQPIASVSATTGTATAGATDIASAVSAGFEPSSPTPRCISCHLPTTARTPPTRTLTPITRKTADGMSMVVDGTGSSTMPCYTTMNNDSHNSSICSSPDMTTAASTAVEHTTTVSKRAPAIRSHTLSKMRVLVVEDNLMTCKLITSWLLAADASVTVAYNGREAVDAVASNAAQHNIQFDLILMDFLLPVLNGVNAMREIRAWESSYYTATATAAAAKTTTIKRTAILGMSGHSLPIDIEAAKHAGMNAFLLKPLHPDALVELIAVLINDSTNGSSTTTNYHQSLQSTMQSSGSTSSTSLSPRKLRATTTITLDSSTRGLLSKEHFGTCGGISGIANSCDALTTNSSTDNTNSSATAAASAATAADECALLKKQVALLQQGRRTVSDIRPRHNTLM